MSVKLAAEAPPRALVVTALQVEFRAVIAHLKSVRRERHKTGAVYEIGFFRAPKSIWEVCVVECGRGNQRAAVETERAIESFGPSVVFFVGVAGGIKDVRIGDVVAATKVYNYESGKETKFGFLPRPDLGESTHRLVHAARAEARRSIWHKRLPKPSGRPAAFADHRPKAIVEPIAAGEKVVAETRSATYRFIRAQYGDACAVEMEGRGFLEAANDHRDLDSLVIRGISDLIEKKTASDAKGSQPWAAATATAFVFEVLANLYKGSAPLRGPVAVPARSSVSVPSRLSRQTVVKPSVSVRTLH